MVRSSTIELDPQALDPNVTQLGLLIGLLQQSDDELLFCPDWFSDPLSSISQIGPQRGAELIALLESLLGNVTGSSLGTPASALNRLWYPIPNPEAPPGTDSSSGVYIVTTSLGSPANGNNASQSAILGLGLLRQFPLKDFTLTVYAYFPLLQLPPQNGQYFVLGTNLDPIELGVQVTGANGAFGSGEVSFNGVKVASSIYFDQPPQLEIVLLNLMLPGDASPADRSLINLIENIDIAEWMKIGVSLLSAQLAQGSAAGAQIDAMVYDLLALLGLTGSVPALDWDDLVEGKISFTAALTQWFSSIAGSPGALQSWLNDWYCLRNGTKPAADGSDIKTNVSGSGARSDPWAIQLIDVAGEVQFSFTIATETDSSGTLYVYPGVEVSTSVVPPVPSLPQLGAQFSAAAELVELIFPAAGQNPPEPTLEQRLFPSFDISATLLNPTPGQPLFRVDDPSPSSGGSPPPDGGKGAFSIGTIGAGLSYGYINTGSPPQPGPRSPIPSFQLTNVTTALRSWDVVDLLHFADDVQLVEGIVSSLLQDALNKFLGTGGGQKAGEVASSIAAVLGILPPAGFDLNSPPDPDTWPVDQMLLSPDSINALVSDPLGALGAYYTRCLTTSGASGQPALRDLLPDLAELLSGLFGQKPAVTGSGTAGDPWQVQVLSLGADKPAAYLQAWHPGGISPPLQPELHLALLLSAPLPISSVAANLGVVVELMSLALPNADGSGSFGARWLQSVAAELDLTGPIVNQAPTPLATPPLAGMSIQTADVNVAAGWDRDTGFYWAASIDDVEVTSTGLSPVRLGNLAFGSGISWQSDLNQLAQVIVNAIGLGLVAHGGRFGVTLTTALGLLPDLPAIFSGSPPPSGYPFDLPQGVVIPQTWPWLNLSGGQNTFFTNPWPELRSQLASLFSSGDSVEPLMQLIGWAIDAQTPLAPATAPAGTIDDPWSVTLTNAWNTEVLAWSEWDGQTPGPGILPARIGIGVGRVMSSQAALGVQLDAEIRVDVAYVNLGGGSTGEHSLPRATMMCTLQSATPGSPLVQDSSTGLQVGSAEFGVSIDLTGIYPVVALINSQLTDSDTPATVELVQASAGSPIYTCNQSMQGLPGIQVIEKLLYAVMNELTEALGPESASFPELAAIFDVLGALNLVQNTPDPSTSPPKPSYGINVGAWDALLANPGAFLSDRMNDVVQDPSKYALLLERLATLIGIGGSAPHEANPFELPPELDGLPGLLAALGLLEPAASGYAVPVSSWLTLLENPVQFFKTQGEQLLSSPAARRNLITALSQFSVPTPPIQTDRLNFSVVSGTKLTLSIPTTNPIDIGPELQVYGDVVLDLQALTLTVDIALASSGAGSAVAFQYTLALGADQQVADAFAFALEAAPSDLPAPFAPLTLYQYPADTGPDPVQLGEMVPLFVVSTFASKLLNDFVLPSHPAAAQLFSVLALTARQGSDKPPQIQSLLGIFMHPIDWVLSDSVLGNGSGQLDLAKLGTLLNAIPGPNGLHGPDGVSLVTDGTTGMMLTGLPYGVEVGLTADDVNGLDFSVGIQPSLSTPAPCVQINAGLSFGTSAGLNVTGDVKLTFDLSSDPSGSDPCQLPPGTQQLTIDASYQQEQFGLSLSGYSNAAFGPFVILPFTGINQFFSSGDIDGLLSLIAGKMVAAYGAYPDKPQALVNFVNDVLSVGQYFFPNAADVEGFISELIDITSSPTGPLQWLLGWFNSPDSTEKTLTQINSLLTTTLKLKGFSIANGMLQYAPPIPVTVTAGTQTVSGKQVFGMWVNPDVKFGPAADSQWIFARGQIGIGVVTPLSPPADFELEFTLAAALGVDLSNFNVPQMNQGPQICLNLEADQQGLQGFGLDLYPLGPASTNSPSTDELAIELLPAAQLTEGGQPVSAVDWLEQFAIQFMVPLVSDLVLHVGAVANFLDQPIGSTQVTTPGAILKAWGLLVEASPPGSPVQYQLGDYAKIWVDTQGNKLTPWAIIEKLVYEALATLLGSGQRFLILPIKTGGIYLVGQSSGTGPAAVTDYGIGLQIEDLAVGTGSTPAVLVQLGKWQTGNDSWITRTCPDWPAQDPGAYFYLLRVDSSDTASIYPRLELVSVGVDVMGAANQPLVNIDGFQLGGIEPRAYFSLDRDYSSDPSFGLSIRCDNLGIPLGPGFGTDSGNANPVAQNLLTSKSGNGSGNKDAINPAFSVTGSYVQQYTPSTSSYAKNFDVQLYDVHGAPTTQVWLPVQRALGPLQCRQIGIGWQGAGAAPPDLLSVLFDGDVSLLGLTVDLVELSVGIPVATPTDFDGYKLDLQGLDISFVGGPVEISGGFLESVVKGMTEYTGEALIKAANFTITGYGSYGVLNGQPSLFIFVFISAPIGGPAFFFVTGLAAGFGYNRRLLLPPQDQVQNFPLVGGLTNPAVFGGSPPKDPLQVLSEDVPPELGEYWLAAGLRFTSFELIDSFALLVVEFGKEFEIALLGLSTIQLPKAGEGLSPYVYAELALEVTFNPDDGLLAATLVLTPNSFVLDQDCRLTGGFAFYVWFSGENKGQFVVTLGGYHPAFNPPSYYPVEPRLGFDWPVSSQISIKGDAYFALTPSCIMAGGGLQALYQDGSLRAWFTAQADFLISWKPFHYDISISVNIGASYTMHVIVTKTFTVDLSADVHIWGPRLEGEADVHWWVISFTVRFGQDGQSSQGTTIEWPQFYSYFLPQPPASSTPQPGELPLAHVAFDDPAPPAPQNICHVKVSGGLLKQVQGTDLSGAPVTVWVVRADQFSFTTDTAIPASEIDFAGDPDFPVPPINPNLSLGVRPLGSMTISSPHSITIEEINDDNSTTPLNLRQWDFAADTSAVPASLWNTVNEGYETPSSDVMAGRMVGVVASPASPVAGSPPPPMSIVSAFEYLDLPPRSFDLPASNVPAGGQSAETSPAQDAFEVIADTIMSAAVAQFRQDVLEAAVDLGVNIATDGRLDLLAATVQSAFQAPPMLGPLIAGESPLSCGALNPAPAAPLAMSRPPAERWPQGPRPRALIRQYAQAGSGRVHTADKFASRWDRQALDAAVSASGDMTLHSGATLIWDLGPVDNLLSLSVDGLLPVRVVTFDRHHALIGDAVLGASVSGVYDVPAGAAEITLTALKPGKSESNAVGWHRHSSLVQVNPNALLGEGVVIHPQSPVRIPRGRRTLGHGLTMGSELVERNLVEIEGPAGRRGWIETIMPPAVRRIVVLLTPDDDGPNDPEKAARAVTLTLPLVTSGLNGKTMTYATLAASEALPDGEGVRLFYLVPQPELQASQGFLHARIRAADGWRLDGVIGLMKDDAALALEPRAVSTAELHGRTTKMQLGTRFPNAAVRPQPKCS